MEIVLDKKNKTNVTVPYIPRINPDFSLKRAKKTNKKSFKIIVKLIYDLHQKRRLDEEQFNKLIIMACANYVENEVELRVEKIINEKFNQYFKEL